MPKISSVEDYIEKNHHLKQELMLLRELILSTEVEETLKWSAPVYTVDGKNVLGLGAFKNHFGIWFFNGVFLKDEKNLLEQAQETTKALRQMKFTAMQDIDKHAVLAYVKEAINNQKLGKELQPAKKVTKATLEIPQELGTELKKDKVLKTAFDALTVFKQKEYCEYITTAKRETTKVSRLEKIVPMIKQGIGLNDKYRNC